MLHEFVAKNRAEIITRCREKVTTRLAPRPTEAELEQGVPLFLDQLTERLRLTETPTLAMGKSAAEHGGMLSRGGYSVGQVVQDYGHICQAITELAIETEAPITAAEFQILNLCLDVAVAEAVTEYGRLRDHAGTERLGRLAHELRGLLHSGVLAFEMLKGGTVAINGSTGAVLGRSLSGMHNLIDRELAEVRLGANIHFKEIVVVRSFLQDVEVAATMDANSRNLRFAVAAVADDVVVHVDREILASVVTNLLHNAFKFTQAGGQVTLSAHATAERVLIEVEDQCGGLPEGKAEDLFRPYEQQGADRSGVGLGLSICRRGAEVNGGEIRVRNHPGSGCMFTVDLPRQHAGSLVH